MKIPALFLALVLPLAASDTPTEPDAPAPASSSSSEKGIRLGIQDKSRELNPKAKSFLLLQQWANEGYYKDEVDLEDVDAYFWHIFSRLPDEVTIYPSENYFYFIDYVAGRQIW